MTRQKTSPLKNVPATPKATVRDILLYFDMKFDSFMEYPPARQCFFTFLESTQNSGMCFHPIQIIIILIFNNNI